MARPKTLCLRLVRALSFIIVLLTIPVGEQPRTVAHVSGPALQTAEAVEPKVMVFPITAGHNDQYPTVYGRLVVWVEAGKASSSQGPIVAYDLMAKRRVEVTGAPTATTPTVWGNTVVWVDGPSQALSILGYDIASGRRFTIAEGLLAPPDRLAISGNTVVWTDWREGDVRRRTGSHVYAYDVVTREERRISPPETGQGYPAISGDTVVWMDFGKGVTDTDIYGYNLREKRLFSISTAPGQQQFPAISGNTVVWRDVDGLRAYELDSAREYLITPRRPEHFAIDGSLVAYAAWDGLDKLYSLYGYDLERKMAFPIRRGVRKIFRYPGVSGNLIVWLESPPDPKVWTEADIYGAWILIGADYGVPSGHFYTQASGQPKPELDARIQILWAHGGADVLSAEKANITVYLFEAGTRKPFCYTNIGVSLAVAKNNEPSSFLTSTGSWRKVTSGSASFFGWDFNDLDVSFARDPANRLYFTVGEFLMHGRDVPVDPVVRSNVWAHAANALTFYPIPDIPIGTYPTPSPGVVRLAPKIQMVWPHGGLPVAEAEKVNITATIFHQEALASMSVPPEHDWPVQLYGALNQEPLRPIAMGQKRLVTANGITYPVWDFNNIDVSAAKDPRNKYFFQVKTSGSEGSNIWVHGADGRTYFPEEDVPTTGCP